MGTSVHVAATGVDLAAVMAVFARIQERERRWTRFASDSELSAINRAGGRPSVVSPDTAALLAAAVEAWRRTGGRFDPSVHDAMLAAGYDRTFDEGPGPGGRADRALGLDDVQVDLETATVIAPPEVRLDLGGIGKGFAADLAVDELLDAGADQAAVSVGGDVRAVGHPDTGWPILAEPWPEPIARLTDGGFCFSSILKRRWRVDGETRHHIIDPTTGRPAAGSIVHAAVAAATATTAEVHATAAIVAGWPAAGDVLEAAGLDGFVVTDDGETHHVGAWIPNPSILAAAADRRARE